MNGMDDARDVLSRCAEAGVTEFCVCAGARNMDLVAILAQAEGAKIWHFFEERCAGFFAVGRMMKTRRPVAVLTTSGTAVAELLAPVIEAHYQGLPLVALTADRPPEFRGSGAPQAIEQPGIFGCYAADDLDSWNLSGPLHLNICQGEPSGFSPSEPLVFSRTPAAPEYGGKVDVGAVSLVMLGELHHDIEESLLALGAPVYAEATSGLRESESLRHLMVREPSVLNLKRVLRIGGVPSCRLWRDLEGRQNVEVISLSYTRYSGLARKSTCLPMADFFGTCDGLVTPDDSLPGFTDECASVRLLSELIPQGAAVFLGNSLPVREWNLAATHENRRLRCFAARGANGIDGQVSAFFGMSEDEAESWLVCGDLTAMYDLSAPWIMRQLTEGRRRIVILNNGGGKIFSKLPAMRGMPSKAQTMIENAHDFRFGEWAQMWGMDYHLVTKRDELAAAVADGNGVIEILTEA